MWDVSFHPTCTWPPTLMYIYLFYFSSRLLLCSCISSERPTERDHWWRVCVSQFHHNIVVTSVLYASKALFPSVYVGKAPWRLWRFSGIISVSAKYSTRISSA